MSDGEQEDDAQKTEEPTPKKLEDARKKGDVPLSREVNNWVMLLAATLIIGFAAGPVFSNLAEVMKSYIAKAHLYPSIPGGLHILLGEAYKEVIVIMALPLVILLLAAFLGPFLQIGPLFSAEKIKPSLNKISIIKGFGRLFSMRSLVEFAKGIFKIGLIGLVGVVIIYPYYDKMEHLVGLPVPLALDELRFLVMRLMIGVLVALLLIALADIVYQRAEHHKKMRMSKQEIKDEYKQMEGDPHVRARLRQLRQERARQRMMQQVPESDVVITNPTHYSIALKYDPEEMGAPVCVAKGVDEVAMRIREVAKENGIILYENKPLARALYDAVEIDETIPTEHYQAVAEIISYVFKLKGKLN